MPRNVEVKARIESVNALKPAAARIADDGPVEIAQDDTFFQCRSGRLKLRTFSSDAGELIEKNGARLRIDLLPGATASADKDIGLAVASKIRSSLLQRIGHETSPRG